MSITKNRTISYHEHFVLVSYYQKKLKEKQEFILDLESKLETTEAKLEVSQNNRITL
tara:strand:+ start:3594 stop:3764 length:171 start_codon:yes stop_codon:yes gene_type:complete